MAHDEIDPQVYDLYDEYCHGDMNRRDFLRRASAITVTGGSALAMAEALLPNYAQAHTIWFTDKRIKSQYVDYDSPGGTSGKMRGYLVQPVGEGPFPSSPLWFTRTGASIRISKMSRVVPRSPGSSRWRLMGYHRSVGTPGTMMTESHAAVPR